jgi:hypothetical protein
MGPACNDINHLLLHKAQRRESIGVESVLTRESPVGLLSESQWLVASDVGEREASSVSPSHIICAKRFDAVENRFDWLTWSEFT